MYDKPIEYWAAFFGAAIYVALKKGEDDAWLRRVAKLISSAALAYGLSGTMAAWVGINEALMVVIIMVLGQIALDLLTALARDQKFIKELIRSRVGGGQNNG